MSESTRPKWFLATAILALFWNILGCIAYLSDVRMTPEQIAALSPAQQQLLASRPAWAVAATAVAVWGGALGSIGLIVRRRWALPVLVASLVGVIAQDYGMFVLSNVTAVYGPAPMAMQGLVLLVSIGLIVLARRAIARGWMS